MGKPKGIWWTGGEWQFWKPQQCIGPGQARNSWRQVQRGRLSKIEITEATIMTIPVGSHYT